MCIGFPTFLNHSIEPNMGMFKPDIESMTKTFVSIKDIKKGEELTLYYSDEFQKYLETQSYNHFPDDTHISKVISELTIILS
jgi:SET domain-containing protein